MPEYNDLANEFSKEKLKGRGKAFGMSCYAQQEALNL
jgi:hypothetical protein